MSAGCRRAKELASLPQLVEEEAVLGEDHRVLFRCEVRLPVYREEVRRRPHGPRAPARPRGRTADAERPWCSRRLRGLVVGDRAEAANCVNSELCSPRGRGTVHDRRPSSFQGTRRCACHIMPSRHDSRRAGSQQLRRRATLESTWPCAMLWRVLSVEGNLEEDVGDDLESQGQRRWRSDPPRIRRAMGPCATRRRAPRWRTACARLSRRSGGRRHRGALPRASPLSLPAWEPGLVLGGLAQRVPRSDATLSVRCA